MAEAAAQPAETKAEVLPLTRRNILVGRETGFWAILVFTISSIGLGYNGLLPFSTLAGMRPGANLAVMIAIAAVFFLLYAYMFAAIGTLAPRFGADYVVASRVISPPLAFVSSWILVLYLGLWGGGLMAWVGRSLVPMFSQALALVMFDKSLLSIGDWAASPSGIVMMGTFGVVIIFLMLIFPPRVTHWALLVGAVVTVAAWALMGYLFASATPGAFQSAWDRFMGDGNFLDHVLTARSLGMKMNFTPGSTIAAGLMTTVWLFWGASTPAYFAREIKKPSRNLLGGVWTGLAAIAVILLTVTVLLQRLVPLEWLASESFLSFSPAFEGQSMAWLPFYALILEPNPFLVYALGIAWVLALLNIVHTMLYAGSRIILAWGEDRLIPRSGMFLHPELRSPLITVLLICLLAEGGVVWAALAPQYFYQVTPIYYIAAAQFLPLLGMTLLPVLRRDWFEQAEGIVRFKVGPLPLISVAGGFSLLNLIALIAWLGSGQGNNLLGWETLLGFAVAFAAGLVWYFGRRYFLMKQGKDIDGLLRRIPEE